MINFGVNGLRTVPMNFAWKVFASIPRGYCLMGFIVTFGWVNMAHSDGLVASCGSSKGFSYFFGSPIEDPTNGQLLADKIEGGKIVLIKLADEWDIQFDDVAGAHSYRREGASFKLVHEFGELLTIIAATGRYLDTYTFDFANQKVVWSSMKPGTFVPKAGLYEASCMVMGKPE